MGLELNTGKHLRWGSDGDMEQFYNDKLVTQELGIGVEVGAEKWNRLVGDFVKREAIEKAVRQIMDEGEEAEEMRSKAKPGDLPKRL